MSNMNEMMRQAQALQRKLAEAQEEIAQQDVTGSAGGGAVTATVSGNGEELKALVIAPEAVDPDDVELLADLVLAAVNEALRAAKRAQSEALGGLAGGLGLPPGLM